MPAECSNLLLATWNVNSLRARLDRVTDWLDRRRPDVVCLQETKVVDEQFPQELFRDRGYHLAYAGQKTYNGVAIASLHELSEVHVGLCGAGPDEDRRLVSARTAGMSVFCAYVPNGKSLDSPSFPEKLDWLRRMRETLDERAKTSDRVVLCGDFNIAPAELDVHDPEAYQNQLHFHPAEHEALANVCAFGLKDAFRTLHPNVRAYTWWDYRAGAFRRDRGLRIDYALLSESLSERCVSAEVDRDERAKPKPSDHAPVLVRFEGL